MIKRRKKTKKKNKYLSKAQKRASERNWNKGRILGMLTTVKNIQRAETTQISEQMTLSSMIHSLNKLLQHWNKSNE